MQLSTGIGSLKFPAPDHRLSHGKPAIGNGPATRQTSAAPGARARYTRFRSTNHTFAGRSASRRMYQGNHALP
jgi:hypothetical protein